MTRRIDPLQRQAELLLLLLGAEGGLTREQIADRIEGYPPEEESMRKALQRDKECLLAQGVPVRLWDRDNEWRYDIRRDEYYLPELGLSSEEQLALELALAVVRVGDLRNDGTLLKLGAVPDTAVAPLVALPSESALLALYDARQQRAAVKFTYNDVVRDLDLWAVRFRNGHWYAVGWDHTRRDQRVFRVDRIEDEAQVVRPATVSVPADVDVDALITDQAHLPGNEPAVAEVWVDALHAPVAVASVGPDAACTEGADGSVTLRFPISHRGAFRSWLFDFRHHAEVLGPPELRADVIEWLQAMLR